VLRASIARAERPPSDEDAFLLDAPACASLVVDMLALREQLRVETASARDRERAVPGSRIVIRLRPEPCNEDAASVRVLVFREGEGERSRVLTLTDVRVADRPRVMALAVADLLRRDPFAAPPPPVSAPSPPPPAAAAPLSCPEVRACVAPAQPPRTAQASAPSPAPPRGPLVFTGVEVRHFPYSGAGLYGPHVGVTLRPWTLESVLVLVDGSVLVGGARDALGDVRLRQLGAAIGIGVDGGSPQVAGMVAARLELSSLHAEGDPRSPSITGASRSSAVVIGWFGGESRFAIGRDWALVQGIALGWALRGFRATADDRSVVGVEGPAAALRLGVSYAFDTVPR
jgi:hypothetical protein